LSARGVRGRAQGALQAKIAHQRIGIGVSPRRTARPGSSDVESPQTSFGHELNRAAQRFIEGDAGSVHDQVWTSELLAEIARTGCSTARATECNDERRIAVRDVPVRALVVSAARELPQGITERNHAIFGTPPGRAPTATGHAARQRRIESRAIDSRLTAGNYLERPLRCTDAPSG